MSFYTSLSGLQASQTDMSVISHNLANVGTNGFKKSRAEFADVMAANFSTDPFKQVGSGTVVKANRQEFKEGNYTSTSNALDLAISGDGFFTVQSGRHDRHAAIYPQRLVPGRHEQLRHRHAREPGSGVPGRQGRQRHLVRQ